MEERDLIHWYKLKEFLHRGLKYLDTVELTPFIQGQKNGYLTTLMEMETLEKQWL